MCSCSDLIFVFVLVLVHRVGVVVVVVRPGVEVGDSSLVSTIVWILSFIPYCKITLYDELVE